MSQFLKTMNKINAIIAPALFACALTTVAANPVIRALPQGVMVTKLSNNGQWGLSQNNKENDEGISYSAGGSVWNISTLKQTAVVLPSSGQATLGDITDDGSIVVGSANGRPAVYDTATKQWSPLPLPAGTVGGALTAVTPDGSRAVGYANITDEWNAIPVLYDLIASKLMELPDVPVIDMNHEPTEIGRFVDISADGRYILGRMSEHLLMPVSMCSYVYDTQTNKVDYIGFTPHENRDWTPEQKGTYFIDVVTMSPAGNYVTGSAYMVHEKEGSEYPDEYYAAYRYDLATGKTEVYDGPYDSDIAGFAVSDNGTVLVSVPAVNPYASMAVRVGNYYYSLEEIYSQAYGIDFGATGFTNTGKPASVSGDGMTLAMITAPNEGYILTMSESWEEAAGRVNLLSNYSAAPAANSVFSQLTNVNLTFTRNVDMGGAANRIKLVDENGKTVASALAAEVNKTVLSVRFRPIALEAGKRYSVEIPEGFVTMNGDATVASAAISIPYTGRRDGAVASVNVEPADGSTFSRLDASTNCIFVQFDATVAVKDGAKAMLRRKGESTVLADLSMSLYSPNTVILYPASRQYLYDGTDYEVIVPAGSVTDLSGAGANDEIVLHYSGNYIREVSADDKYIFSDDCDNYAGFMFYDGDRLAPGTVPAAWGFTADVPWYLVRDDETSTRMALAAHSMFSGSGKADDWAVTPQLYIPDGMCYLSFEAQSYLRAKADRLKVYAYACDNGYSTLTADIVADIRANGELIFDEQLSAGANDETMEGEWTTYTVKLPQFAGKNVYIAFVNDNENQSAVFLNHVEVVHDMLFLTSLTSPVTTVAAESAPVEGIITIVSDILTANSIKIELKDASGNIIDQITQSDLFLDKGKTYRFAFDKELPLKPAATTRFTVDITVNGTESTSVNFAIKNLDFRTTRRVVIEEYSGRDCSNCPMGFVAMENLEKLYPGQIIPVVIRTYESDPLGAGLGSYSLFLGLDNMGAPSGMINRAVACYPMISEGNDFMFSGESLGQTVWLDAVVAQMQSLAEADVDFTATYDAEKGSIAVEGAATFAINSSRNVSLFSVLLEDKCETAQLNGMRYYDDPDLGEWGKGGIYAEREVEIDIDNVARGVYGTTFNGTAGLVPAIQSASVANPFSFTVAMPETVANAENTRFVVMMIDSDTDAVINANVAKVSVINSAISEIEAESEKTEYFDLQGRRVLNPVHGQLLIKRQGNQTSKINY